MESSEDKASAGQPFRAPRAETWNGMIDAGNAFRNGKLTVEAPRPTSPRETDLIKIKNNSGGDRARGQILRISGKSITDLGNEHIWLGGAAPTTDGYFAILREPLPSGIIGVGQVSGCCIARVNVGSTDHKRARAAAGVYVMESADDGPIEILFAPSTGEVDCAVRFGGGGGGGGIIEYKITSLTTKASGPYTGLKAAEAVVHGAPCGRSELIGTTVEVIDHSNELFDEASMVGFTGWAEEMVFLSLDAAADCDTLSPCHWAAINRVCSPNTGIYDAPCPPE